MKVKIKNPHIAACAYRIWCFANPQGWNVTAAEIAEALGLSTTKVRNICNMKGWNERMPGVAHEGWYRGPRLGMDLELMTGELKSKIIRDLMKETA